MAYVSSSYAQLFSGLLIVLLSISLLGLSAAIFLDSQRGTRLARSYWYARMRRTRFMRMLLRNGVGPRLYLNQTGVDEVRQALRNCRRCPHHAQCDCDLVRADLPPVPAYCPNKAVIGRAAAFAAAGSCANV